MKKTIIYSLFILIAFSFVWSCTESNKNTKASAQELAEGLALMETNCLSCHTPIGNKDTRIAPPLIAIKKHYIGSKTTKKEFTEALVAYVKNPTKEASKMPGALEKFGVMPKVFLSDEDLSKIATYMYDTELEAPEWFEKHYEKEHRKGKGYHKEQGNVKNLSPLEKGQRLAMQTKAVLGKNLLGAIQTKGTVGALQFCNTKAIHLTDSMSKELNANIIRLSDQPRNPANKADEPFLSKIKEYKMLLAEGKELKGGTVALNDKSYNYYPILTNAMCLQCHGKKNIQIKPETITKIEELYPEDKAIGYKENELRGIWVVELQ